MLALRVLLGGVVALAVGGIATDTWACVGDTTLAPRRQWTSPRGYAMASATGDFDGDGRIDLAVLTQTELIAGLVRPPGSHPVVTTLPAGYVPTDLVAADLDGDGVLDLVTTNTRYDCGGDNCVPPVGSVGAWLGRGDGTLAPSLEHFVGVLPSSLAAGDLDGDGHADLVVTHSGETTARVLLGRGDGTFTDGPVLPSNGATALALADLDLDGRLDVVVGGAVFYNQGNAQFQRTVVLSSPVDSVLAADLDVDGRADLVMAFANTLQLVRNRKGQPLGTDVTQYLVPARGSVSVRRLAAADLDGDARPEVVLSAGSGDHGGSFVAVLPNHDGQLGTPVTYPTGGSSTAPIGLVDVTGDGALDLCVGTAVAPNFGDGTFAYRRDVAASPDALAVAIADVDGDGVLDVVTTGGGSVRVLRRTRCGEPVSTEYPAGRGVWGLALGDLNGDHRPDIVVSNFDGASTIGGKEVFTVLMNAGDGTFAAPVEYPTLGFTIGVAIGDVDADGKADVVLIHDSHEPTPVAVVFKGRGDGTLVHMADVPVVNPLAVALVDMDADGRLDLVFKTDAISVARNLGGGAFAAAVEHGLPARGIELAVADFDRDGWPDVATGSTIYFNDGHGGLDHGTDLEKSPLGHWYFGYIPDGAGAADFDRDGLPDLVTAGTDFVTVFTNLGGRKFSAGDDYPTGQSGQMPASRIAVGDPSVDGRLALAVANQFDYSVSLFTAQPLVCGKLVADACGPHATPGSGRVSGSDRSATAGRPDAGTASASSNDAGTDDGSAPDVTGGGGGCSIIATTQDDRGELLGLAFLAACVLGLRSRRRAAAR